MRFQNNVAPYATGSTLIEWGNTRVICGVTLEETVPRWMKGTGKGWVTAEYGMLPGSSNERIRREAAAGKQSGRTQEIQRLIGRSLRAVCDMQRLGERQVVVDCDVLQADGGTRTAAVTGAYLALRLAVARLIKDRVLQVSPLRIAVAAISVGMVDGEPRLDLCYEEDSKADVDFNVVMTAAGEFIEVQGTAEGKPFTATTMLDLLALAESGIQSLFALGQELEG